MSNDPNTVIAQRLKALRNLKGLSQKNVARRLNVHPSTVSNYESGKRAVPVELIGAFAALYNTTADDLLKTPTTAPKTTHMKKIKTPLPLYAPAKALRALFVAGLIGLGLTPIVKSDLLLGYSLIILIVYTLALGVQLLRQHKSTTAYYEVSDEDEPVYVCTLDEAYVKQRSRMVMLVSTWALFAFFLVESLLFVSFTDHLEFVDEIFIAFYFFAIALFLISRIIFGAFGRIIKMEIPNEKASSTLGTLSLVLGKGVIVIGYGYHVVMLNHGLAQETFPVGMNPLIFILLLHGVYIVLYYIFHHLLTLHQHYTLHIR